MSVLSIIHKLSSNLEEKERKCPFETMCSSEKIRCITLKVGTFDIYFPVILDFLFIIKTMDTIGVIKVIVKVIAFLL